MKKYIVIADHGIGDLMMSLRPIINLYYQSKKNGFGLTLLVKSKFESDIFKNLLPNIGDKVRATKEETTIANDKAIAVSLNKVPAIPSIKIKGKKTATKIKVVAIIANVICFEPL